MRAGQWVAAGVLAAASLLAAACSAAPSASGSGGLLSGTMGGNPVAPLEIARTAAGPVLASGTGYTLYWFSQDTATSSACASLCVPQWPPLTGAPKPAKGVALKARLGTITRPDGTVQATYDRHPLYTFAGDFDPGDVGGDNVAQFGGTWHAIRLPGA